MDIPKVWHKASETVSPADRTHRVEVVAWGWGEDEGSAREKARGRLARLVERIRRGEPFPGAYAYGSRPLREEILETVGGAGGEDPIAVLTRNRSGAVVMNTARLLFLDVDLPRPGLLQRIRRLFSSADPAQETLQRLRTALQRYDRTSFRVYRTAAGLRAIALNREFDPAGGEAQDLMSATGTDPAFVRLCRAQKSFRARLTPKPWRCGLGDPPGEHPRRDEQTRRAFEAWVKDYQGRSRPYATCRFVESVGRHEPGADARRLIDLHDRITGCAEPLPLA